jgi:protein-disulfide isomerase
MRKNALLPIVIVLVAVVALFIAAGRGDGDSATDAIEGAPTGGGEVALVRADSQRVSEAPSDAVAFVEFLDFECEACRAAHPAITELRATYGSEVSFVVRNFPLHANSEEAARAAEAAAAQGRFVQMMDLLFETQPEWGEKSSSQSEVFFGLAETLGLDMNRFRQVYDDPATLEKIRRDKAEGQALGVSGTPTFFLDGEKLEPTSFEDLVTALEQAIGA